MKRAFDDDTQLWKEKEFRSSCKLSLLSRGLAHANCLSEKNGGEKVCKGLSEEKARDKFVVCMFLNGANKKVFSKCIDGLNVGITLRKREIIKCIDFPTSFGNELKIMINSSLSIVTDISHCINMISQDSCAA